MNRWQKHQGNEKSPTNGGPIPNPSESGRIIRNWASSEDERSNSSLSSPIFSDLEQEPDDKKKREWGKNEPPKEATAARYRLPPGAVSSRPRPRECASSDEDSACSLFQKLLNWDDGESFSDNFELDDEVEASYVPRGEARRGTNAGNVPARSYAAATFAKPPNSLAKAPKLITPGAKRDTSAPSRRTAANNNKREAVKIPDCSEHLPYCITEEPGEGDYVFDVHENALCFASHFANNGSDANGDCSSEAFVAYNSSYNAASAGKNVDSQKPPGYPKRGQKNVGIAEHGHDCGAANNVIHKRKPGESVAEDSGGKMPRDNRDSVNGYYHDMAHCEIAPAHLAQGKPGAQPNEQDAVAYGSHAFSLSGFGNSLPCLDTIDEQDTNTVPYDEDEDATPYQPIGQYSGQYASNPYSFDYDGHPYYYGCFITDSDQGEANEEQLDARDQETGSERNVA